MIYKGKSKNDPFFPHCYNKGGHFHVVDRREEGKSGLTLQPSWQVPGYVLRVVSHGTETILKRSTPLPVDKRNTERKEREESALIP